MTAAATGNTFTDLVSANYSSVWQHISINLGSSSSVTHQICLNATLACDSFSLAFDDTANAGLFLNLYSATFREVKMFSYTRATFEQLYFRSVQSDPRIDKLDFCFPLTGVQSTNYVYEATQPQTLTFAPLKGVVWEASPDGGNFMCPPGYVRNAISADESAPTELPTCISTRSLEIICVIGRTYLETGTSISSASVTMSIPYPTVYSYLGVSFWLLYKGDAANFAMIIGSAAEIEAATASTATTISLMAGPVGTGITLSLMSRRWYHISYAFSATTGTIYTFDTTSSSLTVATAYTMPTLSPLSLNLNIVGVNTRDIHLLGSATAMTDFGAYMARGVFPAQSVSTAPALLAYLPCMSLNAANDLVAFTATAPASAAQVVVAAVKTASETAVHPSIEEIV